MFGAQSQVAAGNAVAEGVLADPDRSHEFGIAIAPAIDFAPPNPLDDANAAGSGDEAIAGLARIIAKLPVSVAKRTELEVSLKKAKLVSQIQ